MPAIRSINRTLIFPPGKTTILAAARLIRRGGLVAFPTETVYGLGADATRGPAVARIFTAKDRPMDNPLIVHVADLEQVKKVTSSLPGSALELMKHFWPGPLSLILPRSAELPPEVSAGLPTVAIRMPAHPVALGLIRAARVPLAAPSANRSGRPSSTEVRHVLEDLAGRIHAVLDGGTCKVGVESTVLDLSGPRPVILRPGGVTREQLEDFFGASVFQENNSATGSHPIPGRPYPHYVPRASLILVEGPRSRRVPMVQALAKSYRKKGLTVGLLPILPGPAGARQAAKNLFPALRRFDRRGVDLILAEGISPRGLGHTVLNRLRQAATYRVRV